MELPQSVSIQQQGNNQILCIDNQHASMKLSLFGAQVFSFVPKHDGRERLWLSPLTHLDGSETIRGGTPLCWPWFANQFPQGSSVLPAHGFVRNQYWQMISCEEDTNGTHLVLECPNTSAQGFPYSAKLTVEITVSSELEIKLITENIGDEAFNITAALHTYFAVDDLSSYFIYGVTGEYLDKTRAMNRFTTPSNYQLSEETDRIHYSDSRAIALCNHDGSQKTEITQEGHDSIVIWNPWQEEARKVSNIPDADYVKFVCIEAAVTQELSIVPGEQHQLIQRIS
ncbi:D-hexose-6-phosphate mutarotase [Paraneptunicella aestuarii]|uniref:D-hexose-6-phosphate mutarotase n=1 Tax=Paraneptunicella aestuarii TaxID=2831148 RepID=UPI001E44A74F|nr:D-hexose-6-phosphate mutarotase [Paraneptunicella aestuarii]UAA40424.1 D-hexose-6-phosphate mutarotase [Paraneptunicella aestuarii]